MVIEEHEFTIEANDQSISKLGSVNVDWEHTLCEHINNSIQAAEDRNLDCEIQLNFYFHDNDKQNISKIQIIDYSGGIKKEDFPKCITPAHVTNKAVTLNEHGMGLNMSIEKMTRKNGKHVIRSFTDEHCFEFTDKVSYQNTMSLRQIERTQKNGLFIEYYNLVDAIEPTFPSNHNSKIWYFWTNICAKYRYKHSSFYENGKKFNISIGCFCGDKSRTRNYVPTKPILMNRITGKNEWLTTFTLMHKGYEIEYKLGQADENRDNYSFSSNGSQLSHQIHPFRINGENFGLDLIYKDVVLKHLCKAPLGADVKIRNGDEYQQWRLLRGEKIIKSGGRSFFTKDGLENDAIISLLDQQALEIFKGKRDHPVSKEKINYIKLIDSKNSNSAAPHEKIIKYRHRQSYESVGMEVLQEVQTEFGRIDMVVNDTIIEHKRKKSKIEDVLQLFKYMVPDTNTSYSGELWAPEHTDEVRSMVNYLNGILASRKQKITLKQLSPSMMNPALVPAERDLL